MESQIPYARFTKICHLTSECGKSCPECQKIIGWNDEGSDLEGAINHLISEHGYTLIHIGTETHTKTELGQGFANYTVAVLGK